MAVVLLWCGVVVGGSRQGCERGVLRVWNWCGSGVGVLRQEYGRGVGGSNLRLGRPKLAFGVSHSTTFSNCCSGASQTIKMHDEVSYSAIIASTPYKKQCFLMFF